MMACELDAPLGVAGIQLEVGQMSGDVDAEDKGFEQFERFLEHWSRRDFLKRAGGATAYMAFAAGGLSFLEACGGGETPKRPTPPKGGPAGGSDIPHHPPPHTPPRQGNTPQHDQRPHVWWAQRHFSKQGAV